MDGPYGQMHVRMAGLQHTGPADNCPLLLLHMFPQSSRGFAPLMEIMGEDRLVIAPDFPGLGDSDDPGEPISAEDYAASIWHAIDGLDVLPPAQELDLFGIHAGAKLAVEVILQRPKRIAGVVLASAAALDDSHVMRIRMAFTPIPLDEEGTRFRKFWDMLIRNCRPHLSYEQIGTIFDELVSGGESYTWGNNAVLDYNTRFKDRLKQLTHHVDLLNPGDDLFEQTKTTMASLQAATYHEKPDWKQGFHIGQAEELAEFLRRVLVAK